MTSSSPSSLSRGTSLLVGLLWCVSFYGCLLFLQGSGALARLQQLLTPSAFLTMPLELAVRRAASSLVPFDLGQTVLGGGLALVALTVALVVAQRSERALSTDTNI